MNFLSFVIWNALESERKKQNQSNGYKTHTGHEHVVVADFIEEIAEEESQCESYGDTVHYQ